MAAVIVIHLDRVVRERIEEALRSKGLHVEASVDVEGALGIAETQAISAVLVDPRVLLKEQYDVSARFAERCKRIIRIVALTHIAGALEAQAFQRHGASLLIAPLDNLDLLALYLGTETTGERPADEHLPAEKGSAGPSLTVPDDLEQVDEVGLDDSGPKPAPVAAPSPATPSVPAPPAAPVVTGFRARAVVRAPGQGAASAPAAVAPAPAAVAPAPVAPVPTANARVATAAPASAPVARPRISAPDEVTNVGPAPITAESPDEEPMTPELEAALERARAEVRRIRAEHEAAQATAAMTAAAQETAAAMSRAFEPNGGAAASVSAEVKGNPKEELAAIAAPRRADGKAVRVLVVEDDLGCRDFFQDVLAARGYHVHSCASVPAAIRYIQRGNRVDLILSDINMPIFDGFELKWMLDNEARLAGLGNVPFLGVSAEDTPEKYSLALRLGAVALVAKPVKNLRTFCKLVRDTLERAWEERGAAAPPA